MLTVTLIIREFMSKYLTKDLETESIPAKYAEESLITSGVNGRIDCNSNVANSEIDEVSLVFESPGDDDMSEASQDFYEAVDGSNSEPIEPSQELPSPSQTAEEVEKFIYRPLYLTSAQEGYYENLHRQFAANISAANSRQHPLDETDMQTTKEKKKFRGLRKFFGSLSLKKKRKE